MAEDQGRTADSFSDDELKEIVKMYQERINKNNYGFKYNLCDIYDHFHLYSREEQYKIFKRIESYTEDIADYTCKYCHKTMKF